MAHESCDNDIFVLAIQVSEITLVNVWKLPNIMVLWDSGIIHYPTLTITFYFDKRMIYVGDFNSPHS